MSRTVYVDFKAVKAAVSISQILDHYDLTERFKRSGDSLSGPCPLHDGQNPTQFRVSLTKNCWNCFGQCKCGGNILDFVARKESVTVRDAAIQISKWFNLPLDEKSSDAEMPRQQEKRDVPEKKRVPERKQGAFKPETTPSETGPNKPLGFELKNLDSAHPYFTERGVKPETVAEFGLGYCNKGSMTGRIVIPIHNGDGQLVAYAGRWPGEPPNEETPKYKLPSGFRKAQELFNLHRAIREPEELPLIVVEGFFDCIKLWQLGIRKVVALMGSSLSDAQEESLIRVATPQTRVVVMLDEDEAGGAGREEMLPRLAIRMFVKVFRFDQKGLQPENLTAEQLTSVYR